MVAPTKTRDMLESVFNFFTLSHIIWLCVCLLLSFHAQADPTTPSSLAERSDCPHDLVNQSQACFTQLAEAVQTRRTSGRIAAKGIMTLDYTKIKEYCAEDGHIMRFVSCVDRLLNACDGNTSKEVLSRLVSSQRVKDAVPKLCEHQEEIANASECINSVVEQESQCKQKAYSKVKAHITRSTGNVTAMFILQCKFFDSLAECQRQAVNASCGETLGDLHADFLLSFVPSTCAVTEVSAPIRPPDSTVTRQETDTTTSKVEPETTHQEVPEEKTESTTKQFANSPTTIDFANSGSAGRTWLDTVPSLANYLVVLCYYIYIL